MPGRAKSTRTGAGTARQPAGPARLPAKLLVTIFELLPPGNRDKEHSRLKFSSTCKGWRAATAACEWGARVDLDLYRGGLGAFLAWAAPRKVTAVRLHSDWPDRDFGGGLLSLRPLAALGGLRVLTLDINAPVDYSGLAGCQQLEELHVVLPLLQRQAHNSLVGEDSDDEGTRFKRYQLPPSVAREAVGAAGRLTLALACVQLLEAGITPLKGLRKLDLARAVAPQGYVRVEYELLPLRCKLAWLPQLGQLTWLKIDVGCLADAVCALPSLRALHVVGYHREVGPGSYENGYKAVTSKRRGTLWFPSLRGAGGKLAHLTFEGCQIDEESWAAPASPPSLRRVTLVDCLYPADFEDYFPEEVAVVFRGGSPS